MSVCVCVLKLHLKLWQCLYDCLLHCKQEDSSLVMLANMMSVCVDLIETYLP